MTEISRRVPAAQYIRMSTDDQPNSAPTQRDAISRYADAHGYEIVATYSDLGISGLHLRNRPALRRLLRDVLSRKCRFKRILVYDVSRWGRFQDTDEPAHYEFLCRRAGVPVLYCAEEFDNDSRLPNAIMKTLKRTMAAEYSRELSVKIRAAHVRMAAEGFHVGGRAGYGFRRVLISARGERRVLEAGECKNLTSDRVLLVPGPAKELRCIRTIFDLATQRKYSALAISEELNRRKLRYTDGQLWSYERVYRILQNEKLLGSTIWGRRNTQLSSTTRPVPRTDWVVKHGAFPAIITEKQYAAAHRQILQRTTKGKTDAYYLNELARALPKPGDSRRTIRRKTCLRHVYGYHLGSLLRAYEQVGYKPTTHVINSRAAYHKIGRLRIRLLEQIKMLFGSRVRSIHRSGQRRYRVLELDGRWRIAMYICRFDKPTVTGEPRWLLKFRPNERELPALICLPDEELKHATGFYFVRDLGKVETKYKTIRPDHPWVSPENRLSSLADLCNRATQVMGRHPQVPMVRGTPYSVGDVAFHEDDSIIYIDGKEVQLSRINASIFKMLISHAGTVVPTDILSHLPAEGNREIYLRPHIGQIRKALGDEFKRRIVTVRKAGYMYQRNVTTLVI